MTNLRWTMQRSKSPYPTMGCCKVVPLKPKRSDDKPRTILHVLPLTYGSSVTSLSDARDYQSPQRGSGEANMHRTTSKQSISSNKQRCIVVACSI